MTRPKPPEFDRFPPPGGALAFSDWVIACSVAIGVVLWILLSLIFLA